LNCTTQRQSGIPNSSDGRNELRNACETGSYQLAELGIKPFSDRLNETGYGLSAGKKEIVMDKTEITSMPDGMSSEELDALTTGEEQETPEVIAQEALDATEEESLPAEESVKDETKPEETPEPEPELSETEQQLVAKDSVIGDFRRKNRDLELEKARLEGELVARKSIQAPGEPKSPLEIAEAAYIEQYGNLVGFAMDGQLYRQQKAFDDKQVADNTAKTEEERAITAMNKSIKDLQSGDLSPEKVGSGLDFRSIVELGKNYLDKADLYKIELISHRDGIPAGVRKTYELCKQAILEANNEDTKLLQNAMRSKPQPKPKEPKPKEPKKPTDIDALILEGEDEITGEAETDTHNQRLTNFIFG